MTKGIASQHYTFHTLMHIIYSTLLQICNILHRTFTYYRYEGKKAAFSSDTHKDIVHHSHIDARHIPTNRGHINIINVQRHYLCSVYTPGHNYHTDQNTTGTCSMYSHAHTKNTYSHINTLTATTRINITLKEKQSPIEPRR